MSAYTHMKDPVGRIALRGVILIALSLAFVAAGTMPSRGTGIAPGIDQLVSLFAPDASPATLRLVAAAAVLCLVCLYWFFVVSSFAHRGAARSRDMIFLVFLVAPATFWQMGYDLGRLDPVISILLIASLVAIDRKRFVIAGLLCALAPLVHEASVLTCYPVVMAAALGMARHGDVEGPDSVEGWPLVAVGAPFALVFGAVMLLSPGHDIEDVAAALVGPWTIPGLLAGLAYFGLFCQFYFRFHAANRLRRDALTWSPLLVLPLLLVSVDFERWLAVSVLNMTVVMSYRMRSMEGTVLEGVVPSRRNLLPALLLASTVLGPLGVETAYPLLGWIWKLIA